MKIGRTTTTAAATTTIAGITATTSTSTSITTNTTLLEDTATFASPGRYCKINFQKRIHIKSLHYQSVKILVASQLC